MFESLRRDLGYAVRSLWRSRGFAAGAILTLALGVGVTTAVYTVVDALLVQPLPLATPERLVLLWETDRDSGTTREPASYPDLLDFRARTRSLDRLAAFTAGDANLTPETGDPARLAAMSVSAGFLPLIGINPVAGRHFTESEDTPSGASVAIISERLATSLFANSHAAVGRTVRINSRARTVIGVAPPNADFGVLQILSASAYGRGFVSRDRRAIVDLWLPLQPSVQQLPRETHPLLLVGRLAPSATADGAQRELTGIATDLENEYPENKARGVHVEAVRDVIVGPVEQPLLLLMVAVGVLFVIACVNVANLVLARAANRARDVAVKTALGAGMERLVAQFLIESTLLALAAVAAGIVLRWVALRTLLAMVPPAMPRLDISSGAGRVFVVAAGAWVLTSVLFAVVPLRYARRVNLQSAMSDRAAAASDGAGRYQTRSLLVAAEIALAVALVTGAGLLTRSFWTLQHVNPGFTTSGVVKAELQLPPARYPVSAQAPPWAPATTRFNTALLERLRALPGVQSVGLAANQPFDVGFTNSFEIPGREEEGRNWPEISVRIVSPDYLKTLDIPLLQGRSFTDSDRASAPAVALINQAAADRFFPGIDPAQREIRFWGFTRRIVGVIGNERFQGVAAPAAIAVYAPFEQVPPLGGSEALILKTSGAPPALAASIRDAIRAIDPALPVFGVEPLSDTLGRSIDEQRFTALLLTVFALNALVLAAIGIHGVLAVIVAQRTREIGIRMAVGATPQQAAGLLIRRAAVMTIAGCGLGITMGVALAWAMRGLLFGVRSTDPLTLLGVLVTMALTALGSAYIPARRVSRVDPIAALRSE